MIELNQDRLHFTFPELAAELRHLFEDYESELLARVLREDRGAAFDEFSQHHPWTRKEQRPAILGRLREVGEGDLREAVATGVRAVRPGREPGCKIDFQRTLRLPDDGGTRYLPPGLGRFPLRHVDDHAGSVPPAWIERGGVMMPMYQSEALWLHFESSYPVAVKVGSGRVNAITGEAWRTGLHGDPQDYLTLPEQPWLDGFAVEPGVVRQFVAVPLGKGDTVEEQITGRDEFGGIQLQAWPMQAREYFERVARPKLPKSLADLLEGLFVSLGFQDESRVCEDRTLLFAAAPEHMGLGMGGRMRQEVYEDPLGPGVWEAAVTGRCFVHLCNALEWRAITGSNPPQRPPTSREYADAGLPWFDHYRSDLGVLEGSSVLAGLKSLAGRWGGKDGSKEESMQSPGPLVHTGPERRPETVREWRE